MKPLNAPKLERVNGSFRDRSGQVFNFGPRLLRVVSKTGKDNYEKVKASGILQVPEIRAALISTLECPKTDACWQHADDDTAYILEHEKLSTISFPYEWTFSALRDAALFHLQLHLKLLEHNFTLSDASAFNVQFRSHQAVFIDVLSLRPYEDGEYWIAHKQFCEHFLNPLMMFAYLGVSPNPWFRGALEGIPTEDLARLLPKRAWLSLSLISHVLLPARMQRKARANEEFSKNVVPKRPLPKSALLAMLHQLHRFILKLKIESTSTSDWLGYGEQSGYQESDRQAKQAFIREYCLTLKPSKLLDLGCNTGEFSELSLSCGVNEVIAIDYDHAAADAAYRRAKNKVLAMHTLVIDLANESPSQGWRQTEREGFAKRVEADGVLALALVHHLTIGKNIPLVEVIDWLLSFAPNGVVEFPQPDDMQVKRLLMFKPDLQKEYNEEVFLEAIQRRVRILKKTHLPKSRRLLVSYSK